VISFDGFSKKENSDNKSHQELKVDPRDYSYATAMRSSPSWSLLAQARNPEPSDP